MKTDLRRLLARGAEDYISVIAEGSNGAAVVWSLQLPQPQCCTAYAWEFCVNVCSSVGGSSGGFR